MSDENRFRPLDKPIGPRTFVLSDRENGRRQAVHEGDMFSVGPSGELVRENCAACAKLDARIQALREALDLIGNRTVWGVSTEAQSLVARDALTVDDEAAK